MKHPGHFWICFWLALIYFSAFTHTSGITVTDNRSCNVAPLSVEKAP